MAKRCLVVLGALGLFLAVSCGEERIGPGTGGTGGAGPSGGAHSGGVYGRGGDSSGGNGGAPCGCTRGPAASMFCTSPAAEWICAGPVPTGMLDACVIVGSGLLRFCCPAEFAGPTSC